MDMKVELVIVPVSDVDRSKAFYEKAGFNVDVDHKMGDSFRVVQLTPPGSACSITIASMTSFSSGTDTNSGFCPGCWAAGCWAGCCCCSGAVEHPRSSKALTVSVIPTIRIMSSFPLYGAAIRLTVPLLKSCSESVACLCRLIFHASE